MDRNKEVRENNISPDPSRGEHKYSRTKAKALGHIHRDTKIVRNILQP